MFGRLVTAMVTPFTDDGLAIDWSRTEALIEHLLSTGTESLVVAGTTGESPTLSHDEKISLFRFVKRAAGSRAKVIAGTGSNDTKSSLSLSLAAQQCGVDGLLLVTPYYNRPSQEGMYQHFKAIAAETRLPCMLYNVPARTGVNLEPQTQLRLSELPNIAASKEAGTAAQLINLVTASPSDFYVYTGEDMMLLPTLSIGGAGAVSVTSHVVGPQMSGIISSYLAGDVKRASEINRSILPVLDGMFAPGYPSPTLIKSCLTKLGIPCGPLRLPLIEPDADAVNRLVRMIREVME
ncbi:MAG: 4-hydroxy-tetrahydrodipicolinate synthase [Bacilli bacterium]|nr:4-hydroxy-tetrahydrodipicolinate synthase [Bacilli bacterium]